MSADNAVLIKVDPLSEGTFGRLGIVIITSVSATMKTVLYSRGIDFSVYRCDCVRFPVQYSERFGADSQGCQLK